RRPRAPCCRGARETRWRSPPRRGPGGRRRSPRAPGTGTVPCVSSRAWSSPCCRVYSTRPYRATFDAGGPLVPAEDRGVPSLRIPPARPCGEGGQVATAEELKARLSTEIDCRRHDIIAISEHIMRHPESGYREARTADFVAGWFRRMGLDCRQGLAI